MKIRHILVSLILLPRLSVTYPFYILSTLLLFSYTKRKSNLYVVFISLFLLSCFFINSISTTVSPSGFLIEYLFILPLLIYASFQKLRLNFLTAKLTIRSLNVFVFFLSVFSMMRQGFPITLPYLDFAPDYYNSLYGLGGAKIVTIYGFFGVLSEIFVANKLHKNVNKIYMLFALSNFLMPSYIIGILTGIISLLPFARKNKKFIVFIVAVFSFIAPYILFRFNQLGFSEIADIPKIRAFMLLIDLYITHPDTLIIGTSLGQFISQSALWSSTYIAELSTHSIPSIPLFYMSEYHVEFFGPIFTDVQNFWMISSSAKKPYNSIVALFAETGVIAGSFIFYKVAKRILGKAPDNYRLSFLIFVFFIFALDIWHDNIFFLCVTLLFSSLIQEKK